MGLLRKLLVTVIIAGPFFVGGIYSFEKGNTLLWASLLVMFVLGQYFIFKNVFRHRNNLKIT